MRNAQISLSCFRLLPECLRAPLEWWSLPALFPDSFSAVPAPCLLCFRSRHTTMVYPVTCGIHSHLTAAGSAIIGYTFSVGLLFLSICVLLHVQNSLFDPCCSNESSSDVISVDFQHVKFLLCVIYVFIPEKTLHRATSLHVGEKQTADTCSRTRHANYFPLYTTKKFG